MLKIFKQIFNKELNEWKQINHEDIKKINHDLYNIFGYTVENDVLYEIALTRFINCYEIWEIIQILQYYNQLQGDDNKGLTQEQSQKLTKIIGGTKIDQDRIFDKYGRRKRGHKK